MMVSPSPQDNSAFSNDSQPVYEHRAANVTEPFRADHDDVLDISFADEAIDEMSFCERQLLGREIPAEALKLVSIEKTAQGFGFNIVGGTDNPHFVGDNGIYVSSVNPEAKSYGTVRCGDKILSFDGEDMTDKTHDEAVDVFRGVPVGHVAKMLIDREYLMTQEDRTQSITTPSAPKSVVTAPVTSTPPTASTQNQTPKSATMTPSESKGRLTSHGISAVIERIRGKMHDEEDDARSVTSYAPSTHSIIDDVPRTPRKPLSLLDPRNNSWITEALYVSIGLGALTLSGYLVYRFIRGRK